MSTRTKGPACEDCAIFHEANQDSTHVCETCERATCDRHFEAGECPGCGRDPEEKDLGPVKEDDEDGLPRCQGCGAEWNEAWGTHCPSCER